MPTISPALNGFLKGILIVVLAAVAAYASDVVHLGFLSPGIAVIVASLASSAESYIKSISGQGLFGAVNVA